MLWIYLRRAWRWLRYWLVAPPARRKEWDRQDFVLAWFDPSEEDYFFSTRATDAEAAAHRAAMWAEQWPRGVKIWKVPGGAERLRERWIQVYGWCDECGASGWVEAGRCLACANLTSRRAAALSLQRQERAEAAARMALGKDADDVQEEQ